MCISCKTTPLKFDQQFFSFGQKSIAVFGINGLSKIRFTVNCCLSRDNIK